MKKIFTILTVLLLCIGFVFANAQTEKATPAFPTKNIDWIVPVAAGAPVDLHVRALANAIDFGQSSSVTNMPGASQVLGITEGFSRPADGYTIVSSAFAGLVIQPSIVETPYNMSDFRHIAAMNESSYNVIVTAPGSAIDSWETLKSKLLKGERVLFTSGNAGSTGHLAFLSIIDQLGAKGAEFVSYNGAAEACTATMGKHVDIAIIDANVAKNYVQNGTLKNILSLSDNRIEIFSNDKCAAEVGIKGMDSFAGFLWVCVKKDTPEEVVNFIKEKIYAAVESPSYQDFLKTQNEKMSKARKEEEITPILLHAAESFKDLSAKFIKKK